MIFRGNETQCYSHTTANTSLKSTKSMDNLKIIITNETQKWYFNKLQLIELQTKQKKKNSAGVYKKLRSIRRWNFVFVAWRCCLSAAQIPALIFFLLLIYNLWFCHHLCRYCRHRRRCRWRCICILYLCAQKYVKHFRVHILHFRLIFVLFKLSFVHWFLSLLNELHQKIARNATLHFEWYTHTQTDRQIDRPRERETCPLKHHNRF